MESKAIDVITHIRVFGMLLLMSCIGCTRSHSSPNAPGLTDSDRLFVKDSVYSFVSINSGAGLSYSLLLPATYDPQRKHALFLFLDPHADGALPITKYRAIATAFDAVCIGSNNAKNGMPAEQAISNVKNALADAISRFSIDEQAVFLVGFSGGARLAGSMIAQGFPAAGIIACSAGLPRMPSLNQKPVALIAGLDDANLAEMLALEDEMKQQNSTPGLYCYPGGHAWPPDSVMQQAMRMLVFRHIGADLPVSWCSDYEADFARKASHCKDLNDPLTLHRLCEERKHFSLKNPRTDNDRFYRLDEANSRNGRVVAEQDRWRTILATEEQCKNTFMQALNTEEVAFWREELQKLRSNNAADETAYHMNQRLLGWLGLVLYSFSNRAVESGVEDAERYVAVYHLLEPLNAEADYLQAVLLARQGVSTEDLLKQLQLAVDHGFSEPGRVTAQAAFAPYAQHAEFQKILSSMKEDIPH